MAQHTTTAPHQVVRTIASDGRETHTCGALSVTRDADALHPLLRKMGAQGMSGPAEVRDAAGKLLLTVADIGRQAKFRITEGARSPLALVPFRPFKGIPLSTIGGTPRPAEADAVAALHM
jgi:hypothetical protein